MKCTSCGKEYAEKVKFCYQCGAALDEQETEPEAEPQTTALPEKPQKKRNKIYAAAGVAILALFGATLLLGRQPAATSTMSYNNIMRFYDREENRSYVIFDGKLMDDDFAGKMSDGVRDLNNSCMIFTDEDKTLFYIDQDQVLEIADDVEKHTMSSDGTTVAYINDDHELFLYDIKKQEEKKIDDDLIEEKSRNSHTTYLKPLVMSPDGKTLAYNSVNEDEDIRLHIYHNENIKSAGKDIAPIAITDQGICFAINEEDNNLYEITAEGEKERVDKNVAGYFYLFNKSHTEIVYSKDGGKTYFYQIGGSPVKLANDTVYSMHKNKYDNYVYRFGYYNASVSYDMETLTGSSYAFSDDTIYLLTKDQKAEPLVETKDLNYYMKVDDTIYYIDDGTLSKIEAAVGAEPKELAEDVIQMDISKDKKTVYILDTDHNLFINTGKENKMIMEDVTSLLLTIDDELYFVSGDYDKEGVLKKNTGTLYQYHTGKEPVIIAEEMDAVGTIKDSRLIYFKYGPKHDSAVSQDVYIQTSNKGEFEKVLENVE